MNNFIKINIPFNTKVIMWKKKKINEKENLNIFMFNNKKEYKLTVDINNKYLMFDKWTNTILIDKSKINFLNNKINKIFNYFLNSWNSYFFNKIKFKGKGFRIKFFKKIKLIKFYFGRSHKTFVLLNKIKRKRINKYKFLLIGLNKTNVVNNVVKVVKIKPINIYTLRGLRCSKQIIFKRKGKKGTYI